MEFILIVLKWYGISMAFLVTILFLSFIISINKPYPPVTEEEYDEFMEYMKKWKKWKKENRP